MNNWEETDFIPVYTIGITSELTETSVYALRMYEKRGIILPYITKTNRRLFSKSYTIQLNSINDLNISNHE